jgi:hypothetical protein
MFIPDPVLDFLTIPDPGSATLLPAMNWEELTLRIFHVPIVFPN